MIFQHDNYRDWIKSELAFRKKVNPLFSLSAFSKKLKISQPLLTLILQGKRRLTLKSAKEIAQKLKLNSLEKEYLLALVEFDRDQQKGEKIRQQIKNRADISELSLEKFEVMSNWYFSALLEMVLMPGSGQSLAQISKRLGLSIDCVEKSLETLVKLDLLEKKGNSYTRKRTSLISTPHDIASMGLKKFHKEILSKASEALDLQPLSKRQISGYTLAINPSRLPEAKKMIQDFSAKLVTLLEDGDRKEVYQLSVALFSLEKYPRGKHE